MTRGFVKLSFLALGLLSVFGIFALISAVLVSNQSQKQDLRSKAAPATTLYMDQNSLRVLPNGNFTLNAVLNPGENLVTAAEIHLKFDPSKVALLSIDPDLTAFQEVLGQGQTIQDKIKIDNTQGTASFSLGTSSTAPVMAIANVAALNFKAKETVASTTVEFENTSAVVALNETTPTIINGQEVDQPINVLVSATGTQIEVANITNTPTPTISPTPTVTATQTPTSSPTASPTITMSPTPTVTLTPTTTLTPTSTPTATLTPTATVSPTPTITPTSTLTPTSTPSPTPIPDCVTTNYIDTFDSATLNPDFWNLRNVENGSALVNNQNHNLDLAAPSNSGKNTEGGIITKHKICGNFTAEIDYANFASPANKNTGVLTMFIDPGLNNYTFIERDRNNGDDKDGFQTNMHMSNADTVWNHTQWQSTKTDNAFGKLKIKRVNSTIYTYFDQGFGWQLQGVFTDPKMGEPVNLAIRVGSWGEDYPAVSGNIDNFKFTKEAVHESTDTTCTASLYDTFDNQDSLYKNWNRIGNYPAVISNGTLLSQIRLNTLAEDYSGVRSKKMLCGDFDISVDISSFNPEAENYTVSGINVFNNSLPEGNTKYPALYLELVQANNNRNIGTDLLLNDQWKGNKIEGFGADFTTLRIRRIGSHFDSLYKIGDSPWKLLKGYPGFIGPAIVSLYASSRNPDKPNVSANFDNFILGSPSGNSAVMSLKFNSLTGNVTNNLLKNVNAIYRIKNAGGQIVFNGNIILSAAGAGDNYDATLYGLPTGNLTVWVKPDNFLARNFNLNMSGGINNFDLTTTKFLAGDLDADGNSYNKIDIFDFGKLVAHFGDLMPVSGSVADMDKNGKVDIFDFAYLVQGFSQTGAAQ